MARGLAATPWVEELLPHIVDEIETNVAPRYRPKWNFLDREYEEYGCGHYGCVLPTHDSDVVLKLTTDRTEALFVTNVLHGDQDITRGLVRYHAIRWVVGRRREDRDGVVFAIWREAIAPYPGELTKPLDDLLRHITDATQQLFNVYMNAGRPAAWFPLLARAAELEDVARAKLRRSPGHGRYAPPFVQFFVNMTFEERALGVAKLLVYLDQELRSLPATPLFLDALRAYYEQGWLFADVRGANLGYRRFDPRRPGWREPELVISDPGHAGPLREDAIDLWNTNPPPTLGKPRT